MSVMNLSADGTGYGRIDMEDAIAAPAFLIGTLVTSGIASITLFDFDLTAGAVEVAGVEPSWAFLISIAALGFAWMTNQPDLSRMDDEYTYLVGGMGAVLLANEFWDAANEFIVGSDAVGVVVVMVMAAGYYAVSYLG